ncbi:MAG: DUF1499 domain-containing protein [Proteobacteria bacterium]|nr:DUF1499 domain-containing protein [Pseudomonadota bacterium]
MKIVLIIISTLILAPIIVFFVLGLMSQSGEANGIVEGKLTKCPDKPNCICTEFEADVSHYIDPVVFSQSNTSKVLSRLKNSVREMGGSIQAENDNYLAATFSSSIFRFVDDLEIRIDRNQKMIHLRSASRVGYSDRGVNKKRIERLKNLYELKME